MGAVIDAGAAIRWGVRLASALNRLTRELGANAGGEANLLVRVPDLRTGPRRRLR